MIDLSLFGNPSFDIYVLGPKNQKAKTYNTIAFVVRGDEKNGCVLCVSSIM